VAPASPGICTGGSVVLTATPTDGLPPYTYAWSNSGGALGTAASQTAATVDTYSVVITDACGGSVTRTVAVTANSFADCYCTSIA
jgi:hypothetical protein